MQRQSPTTDFDIHQRLYHAREFIDRSFHL